MPTTNCLNITGQGLQNYNGTGTFTNVPYLESTWTPAVQSSNSNMTGISYNVQVGLYQKIGKWVRLSAKIDYTAASAGTGFLIVTGLPFTVNGGVVALNDSCTLENITWPGGETYAFSRYVANATQMNFFAVATAVGASQVATSISGIITFDNLLIATA